MLQQVIIDMLDEITAVINKDTGKTRQDAFSEVFMTVDLIKLYRNNAQRWLHRHRVSHGIYFFKSCYIEPRPYGVVLIITPWNYPFYMVMPPVIAALLAGNTVVMKPSEVSPASSVMMEMIFKRIPELAPFVRVVHGDASVGAALVKAKPNYIFLTGATPTGRKVMQAAAENLIPVACELGGKDALIVLEDANTEEAARWSVWGACYNTGQTCMAVERAYVVEKVYDEFVHYAVAYSKQIKMGYTDDINSPYNFSSMTDPRLLKSISLQLDDAVAKGAKIIWGGQIKGMYIEPTVVVDVDHNMLLMCEETNGPILPIMKVKDEVEAIEKANDSIYGLGASIWSNNHERAMRVAHQVEAGTILVNDTIVQIAIPMLPYGGVKQSGFGRMHGKEGFIQFTQPISYAIGGPPVKWDIATIMRKPGNYRLGFMFLHLLFGISIRQRIQPIINLIRYKQIIGRLNGKGRTLS
jgi:succinate-semialdehyde dehydrogenase/glutarate-semialdehyde dehydrogenase